MKKIKSNWKRAALFWLVIPALLSNWIYAQADDYKFKYTDKYLENKTLQKSIQDKTLLVVDEETGKELKYEDYRKKYEKRYAAYAKLEEPEYPQEPLTIKSLYKKPDKEIQSKIYSRSNKDAISKMEKKLGIKITDEKAVKAYNTKKFKKVEKLTGIKTNERFYEESIKNTIAYIERKTAAQIHNANNPYRKDIESILKKPQADNSLKINSLAYSLFYNLKYEPELLDFEGYTYDIPYSRFLGGDRTGGSIANSAYPYRSDQIKMLFLDGDKISNEYTLPAERKDNETYISDYNEEKELASERDGVLYPLIGNKYTDLIYDNAIGFDCWFQMGSSLCKAEFYFYRDKLVVADIILQSEGESTHGK